jgi:hypothetical protein
MQQGHLPFIESDAGKLVSPADLPDAKKRARRGHDRGHVASLHGHDRGHDNTDTATDADTVTATALSSTATAQMEAIRDQWLQPLVDRIEELSRENGRLEQERDTLLQRVTELEVQSTAAEVQVHYQPHAEPETVPVEEPTSPVDVPPESAWRRFWRTVTGG